MNVFADLTTEEYEAKYLKLKPTTRSINSVFTSSGKDVPETVDLRDSGVVSEVKN